MFYGESLCQLLHASVMGVGVCALCPSAGLSPFLPVPHVQERSGGVWCPEGENRRGTVWPRVGVVSHRHRCRSWFHVTASWVASCFVVMMPSSLPVSSSCGGLWCAAGEKCTQAVNLEGALGLQRHRKSCRKGLLCCFFFAWCFKVFCFVFCWFLCSVCCFGFNVRQFNYQIFAGVQQRRGFCDQAELVVTAEHGGGKGEVRGILCWGGDWGPWGRTERWRNLPEPTWRNPGCGTSWPQDYQCNHCILHVPAAQQRPHEAEITVYLAVVASGSPGVHNLTELQIWPMKLAVITSSLKTQTAQTINTHKSLDAQANYITLYINFQFWLRAEPLWKPPFLWYLNDCQKLENDIIHQNK